MNLAASIPLFLAHVAAHNEPATLEAYSQRLAKFVSFADRRHVTRQLVNEWIQHLLSVEKLSKRTERLHCGTVRQFYTWLVENEYETKNPVVKGQPIPVSHLPKVPFTDDELERLMADANDDWVYAIQFGNDTGLRLSDVALMRWGGVNQLGVDFQRKAVRWMPLKTKRFEKIVEIPLAESCLTMLERMKLAAGSSPYVAPAMASQYQADQHRTLSQQFIRLARKVRVMDKSFHNFRATFISRCLANGMSPAVLASMTAHSLSEIMTYCSFSLETKREAMLKAVNL